MLAPLIAILELKIIPECRDCDILKLVDLIFSMH